MGESHVESCEGAGSGGRMAGRGTGGWGWKTVVWSSGTDRGRRGTRQEQGETDAVNFGQGTAVGFGREYLTNFGVATAGSVHQGTAGCGRC